MTSPTQLTLKKLRDQGYIAEVVEKYVRTGKGGFRKDLFGFIDVLAIKPNEVLGVQATSRSHVRNRCNKIAEAELVGNVRDANIKIEVWGWDKKDGRWRCKTVDCS